MNTYKVCYSVKRDGSTREMPASRNLTMDQAERRVAELAEWGYVNIRISPDTF